MRKKNKIEFDCIDTVNKVFLISAKSYQYLEYKLFVIPCNINCRGGPRDFAKGGAFRLDIGFSQMLCKKRFWQKRRVFDKKGGGVRLLLPSLNPPLNCTIFGTIKTLYGFTPAKHCNSHYSMWF